MLSLVFIYKSRSFQGLKPAFLLYLLKYSSLF